MWPPRPTAWARLPDSYDANALLRTTTYPDGSFEATEYDASGRVIATTDRRGKRSTMEYDAAGRQTASVDATGRRSSQTFDENGNRKTATVGGRTTNFEYDALDRLTKTTWPDGSTHTSVYRVENRKQSETDPKGVITSYGYDVAGRLTSVAQSLSAAATATTTYGYDETGAKVRQVDPLGKTTTWTLDGNGRITSRAIQDGTKETSQYDAEGNRLTKTTFAGETLTYQYDSENRVTGQIVPAGAGGNSAVPAAVVSYSYTASGQLQSQTEQGATTLSGRQSYQYDSDDRVSAVSGPTGDIRYGYDAAGNITERSYASGGFNAGTTRYTYDDAGRMTSVTAPDGKQARYTYDTAGRLATSERELAAKDGQPQVLVTYRAHDTADRQIAIATTRKTGAVETLIAGQAIVRTSGGTVQRLETYRSGSYNAATGQFQGTADVAQAFQYDGNARLTRELRTKAGIATDTLYEYDAAGNRTKKTVIAAASTDITTYSYDSADRLTTESVSLAAGGSRVTTYTWDGNGNLAGKTEPGKVTLYRFDGQHRLIDIRVGATAAQAQATVPTASYAYDASGNRIRKGGSRSTVAMRTRRSPSKAVAMAAPGTPTFAGSSWCGKAARPGHSRSSCTP
jgi:YD repeat-containing protein